mgnify:CR=1 FL=1
MAGGYAALRKALLEMAPADITNAMARQMKAEREKRAVIATSEGKQQEQINLANGARAAAIAKSEGEKQAEINQAQGEASAILAIVAILSHEVDDAGFVAGSQRKGRADTTS